MNVAEGCSGHSNGPVKAQAFLATAEVDSSFGQRCCDAHASINSCCYLQLSLIAALPLPWMAGQDVQGQEGLPLQH
jgi:hypothetical protein